MVDTTWSSSDKRAIILIFDIYLGQKRTQNQVSWMLLTCATGINNSLKSGKHNKGTDSDPLGDHVTTLHDTFAQCSAPSSNIGTATSTGSDKNYG